VAGPRVEKDAPVVAASKGGNGAAKPKRQRTVELAAAKAATTAKGSARRPGAVPAKPDQPRSQFWTWLADGTWEGDRKPGPTVAEQEPALEHQA
jgi:hypothetical protein